MVNCGPVATLFDLIVPTIRIGLPWKLRMSRYAMGVIAVYPDRIVTGRTIMHEPLPLAAYRPDGAVALAGWDRIKKVVSVPMAEVVSVHVTGVPRRRFPVRPPGFLLEIVPLLGDPILHFLDYEDARWVLVTLRHFLGARLVEDATAAALTVEAEPAPPDILKPRRPKPHKHKDKKRAQPFRHPKLGLACKILGVIAFIAGYLAWHRGSLSIRFLGAQASAELYAFLLVFYCLIGTLLIYLGYRLSLQPAESVMANDTRAPIVYLRSFHDDGNNSFNPIGATAWMLGLEPSPLFKWLGPLANINPLRLYRLLREYSTDSAEEQVATELSKRGPFVAIGKPGETFSQGGAARFYVANESWQETVQRLVAQAQIVVLQPADTAGVWWEVDHVMRTVPPERLLISLVNYRTAMGAKQGAYDNLRVRMGQEFGVLLPPSVMHAAFLWFSPDWTAHELPSWYRSPFAWPVAPMAIRLDKTLAPYLAARDGKPAPQMGSPKLATMPKQLLAIYAWVAIGIVLNIGINQVLLATGLVSPERTQAKQFVQAMQAAPDTRVYPGQAVLYKLSLDTAWQLQQAPDTNTRSESYLFKLGDRIDLVVNAKQQDDGPIVHTDGVMERAMQMIRNVDDNVEVVATHDTTIDNHFWREAVVHGTSQDSTHTKEEISVRAYGGWEGQVQIFTVAPEKVADIYEPVLHDARNSLEWIPLGDFIKDRLRRAAENSGYQTNY